VTATDPVDSPVADIDEGDAAAQRRSDTTEPEPGDTQRWRRTAGRRSATNTDGPGQPVELGDGAAYASEVRQCQPPSTPLRALDVVEQRTYEIAALVERSRVAAHLWHFLNATTVNLIEHHLWQDDP
jgi:hypothetical protein